MFLFLLMFLCSSSEWFEKKEKQGMFHLLENGKYHVGTNPQATEMAHNTFLSSDGRVSFVKVTVLLLLV